MDRLSLALLVVAGALACSTDPTPNIGGQWEWSATFNEASGDVTCVTSGSILFGQSGGGNVLTGQRSNQVVDCVGAVPTLEDALRTTANVNGAEIHGNTVTMDIDFCEYEGTLTEGTPNGDVISGTLQCPDGLIGLQPGVFTGPWEARR